MTTYAFSPPEESYLDIVGSDEKFPVRRIYCIGKNYLAHVREMEQDERDPPVIFMKPRDALVRNGGEIPYPVFTTNLHYECELIVAMGSGGYNIPEAEASMHGYAPEELLGESVRIFSPRDSWKTRQDASLVLSVALACSYHRQAATGAFSKR